MLPLGASSDHDQVEKAWKCLWTTLCGGLSWDALSFKSRGQKKTGDTRELTHYFPVHSRYDFLGVHLPTEGRGKQKSGIFPLCQCWRRRQQLCLNVFPSLLSSICSRCPFRRRALCDHVSLGYLCVLLAQEMTPSLIQQSKQLVWMQLCQQKGAFISLSCVRGKTVAMSA